MGCETARRKIEGIEETFEVEGRVGAPESKRVVTESICIKLRFISIDTMDYKIMRRRALRSFRVWYVATMTPAQLCPRIDQSAFVM